MALSPEHRQLIENIIKTHPKYAGHEHLMEKFCSEVYKKSYLLLDSVSNIDSLRNYLTKVADTSITNVIQTCKNDAADDISPVLNKQIEIPTQSASMEKFSHTEEADEDIDITLTKKLADLKASDIKSIAPKKKPQPKVVSLRKVVNEETIGQKYSNLIDPIEFFPNKAPSAALTQRVADAIRQVHFANAGKKYMHIFKMRNIQGLRQSVIARKLKISQADLSKRYCEMVKQIQQVLS